jgi:hypothetical protein
MVGSLGEAASEVRYLRIPSQIWQHWKSRLAGRVGSEAVTRHFAMCNGGLRLGFNPPYEFDLVSDSFGPPWTTSVWAIKQNRNKIVRADITGTTRTKVNVSLARNSQPMDTMGTSDNV